MPDAGIEKFDGYNEAWLRASFPVTSLKELRALVFDDEEAAQQVGVRSVVTCPDNELSSLPSNRRVSCCEGTALDARDAARAAGQLGVLTQALDRAAETLDRTQRDGAR